MSEKRKEINYVVALVNEFAKHFNITSKQAFAFLYDFKAIEFVKENYEIEHTLSFDEVINDCAIICHNNGGVLV